jgi:hypothetical protein
MPSRETVSRIQLQYRARLRDIALPQARIFAIASARLKMAYDLRELLDRRTMKLDRIGTIYK